MIKKSIIVTFVIFLLLGIAVLYFVAIGRPRHFMCSQSAQVNISTGFTFPDSFDGATTGFALPGIEEAVLTVHNISGNSAFCTLLLRGVSGRELFHIQPSQVRANGGSADYWIPSVSLEQLHAGILNALSSQNIQAVSVKIDFKPRYQWETQ